MTKTQTGLFGGTQYIPGPRPAQTINLPATPGKNVGDVGYRAPVDVVIQVIDS